MKRYTLLYTIAAVLAAFVTLPAQAQQTDQDALYIFRNDGGFNAFFFDDIDHFEYSCIDTLGIEHDDYVVQEVHAMDSIFRIPLSAIDSIAFVTPKPVYKKDIIQMDKSIADFITASDSVNWIRLDNNTPENLIPKKGDKILLERSNQLIPEGFGGRVTNVEKTNLGTIITTEALLPEEAFEQAVFKASFGSEAIHKARTREEGTLYGSEVPVVLGPFNGSVKLSGSTDFIEIADLFYVSGNLLGEVQYDINPIIQARGFYSIDKEKGIHFDNYIKATFDINTYAKVTGTISTRLDAPFPSVYTFANPDTGIKKGNIGYAKALWKVGMFMEGGGDVHLEGAVSGRYNASASLSYYNPGNSLGTWTPDYQTSWEPFSDLYNGMGMSYGCGDFYFTDGLFLEAAFEFTNPLTKSLIGFGHRFELAPKISANSVVVDKISSDLNETLWGDQAYLKLDKDDIFKFDLYASWDPYVKRNDWQFSLPGEKLTKSLFSHAVGAVPSIQLFRVYNGDEVGPFYGLASYSLQRQLAFPSKVGFVLEDADEKIIEQWWRPESYQYPNVDMDVEHEFFFDPLLDKATWYYVHPIVTFLGKPMLTTDYGPGLINVDPAYVNTPEKIELNDKEEEILIDIPTNIPDVVFFTSANWLEVEWYQRGMQLELKHGEVPDNLDSRQAILYMTAKTTKGEVLFEREIPVMQKGNPDKIKFTVTPSTIDVPGYSTEFQNGSLTKQFTVTYPRSATALRVSSSDESWLRADNGGGIGSGSNTCNITIDGNTSMKTPRRGTITVELTKADGTTVTKTVEVKQSALELKVEPKPGEVTLEAQENEESKYSDKKTVKVEITPYDNFIASLIKNQEVTPNAEWIKPSISGSTVEIYAEANPVEEDRENTVTYKLTLNSGDVVESTIKVLQLALAGNPNVVDAGALHFPAKGGDHTFTIDVPNVDHITDVNAVFDWIGVAGSGLKVTVVVKENTRAEVREGVFRVDVSMKDGKEGVLYYMVTQDAGEEIGEISSIDLYLKVAERTVYDDGDTYSGTYDRDATVSTDKGEITTSPYGKNGLHVVCSQTIDYWHLYKYTVTFDIDDIYGISSKTAKILNLSFHLTEDDKSDSSTTHGEEGIKISSIPMNGENQWGGTAGGGIVFSNFVDKYSSVTYNDDGDVVYSSSKSASLVDDPSNMVRIKLHFR